MMGNLFKIFIVIALLLFSFQSFAQAVPKWKIGKLEEFIDQSDKPVIVNFWATFCKPCIEEVPYFQKLVKKYEDKGVKLLLVSLDTKDAYQKIKAFTQKHKFTAPVVFLDETNADLFCPKIDSDWSGAIPASLFVNNKTGHRKFYEEQIPEQKLEEEIKALVSEK